MWVVVHFLNEDTVEAVPETWYRKKDKTCAWPIVSKKSKKCIEKKDYPDEKNYQWLPARMLGRKYGSLEEARMKTNRAQFYSDLSANEDLNAQRLLKSKSKMESPPSLRLKKIKKTVENTGGFDDESDIEDGHDSDKDPDYHISISVNDPSVSQTMTNHNNKYVMNSPIGKISIEETNLSIMSSMPPKQPLIESITLPSPQRSNTTPSSNLKKRVLFSTVGSKGSNYHSSNYNTELYGMPNAARQWHTLHYKFYRFV
ncbi:uncharacterized protein LOC111028168 [Myzus persicae]|uniref:uncharacterized protein LOC111028168 n=1 Tax=Myzus persicae TaxID=13164 RepID=UPI000B930F94|nr:uncharacterized protein LOC111028168 [Myzus persicae]